MLSQFATCSLRLLSYGYMAKAVIERGRGWSRKFTQQRDQFYNAVWHDSASRLGAKIAGLGDEIFEISLDDVRTRVCRNSTAIDDPVTLSVASNKPLVHRLLAQEGVAVPAHVVFSLRSVSRAAEFLSETWKQSGRPCVVKPARGTAAGHGVVAGVITRRQLRWATAAALRYGERLLIEEQCSGDNYRLMYLDGRLLDAVKRDPPAVVGDGRSSVRTLIDRANRARLAGGWRVAQVPLGSNRDMKYTLSQQGLSLRSVPADGTRVTLKTAVSENSAAENRSVTGDLCPSVIEAGARAALAVGVRFAGVDIVTPDPGQPLHENGGVVLEVNTTPSLYYHSCGESCPVALRLLGALLRESQFVPTKLERNRDPLTQGPVCPQKV